MSEDQAPTLVVVEDDPGHARLIERNLRRAHLPYTLVLLAACRREKSDRGLNGSWGKNWWPAPKAVARLGRLGTFHHWFFVLQAS
jgi:hypothetical protein